MFIDIIGWIIIVAAILLVIGSFMKNDNGEKSKWSERAFSIVLAVILLIVGVFATGHTKRVNDDKAAAARSSKLASSKRESSEKASFSKTASEAKNTASSSSSKSDSSGDVAAFKQSVNELASNKGATATVSDDEVEIIVSDTTGESNEDIANEFIPRIQKLANMCDLSSMPFIYIQTQSGDNVARTTITGGIKIYK